MAHQNFECPSQIKLSQWMVYLQKLPKEEKCGFGNIIRCM